MHIVGISTLKNKASPHTKRVERKKEHGFKNDHFRKTTAQTLNEIGNNKTYVKQTVR